MSVEPGMAHAFSLYLEAWPQADLQLQAQRPLALARQDVALRLAQVARDAGAPCYFLTDGARALSQIRLAAKDLVPVTGLHPQDSAGGALPGSRTIFVRWGSGSLLTHRTLLDMADAARDGRAWGNRAHGADIWASNGTRPANLHSPTQGVFPPTAATLFRLLTGSDLSLLSTHEPAALSAEFTGLSAPIIKQNVLAVTRLMTKRTAELVVIGDPGADGWKYLERETACRVRLLADSGGGLLAALLHSAGPKRFAKYLTELGQAALINTRILFSDSGYPSSDDFFLSDLGETERIAHLGLRALTETLLASEQAVVLGGASLVTGGMYLMVEKAWQDRELPQQMDTFNAQSENQSHKGVR